jgi:hypothetical protein
LRCSERRAGALSGLTSTLNVDFFSHLRGLGENSDVIALHFDESPGNGEVAHRTPCTKPDFSSFELRQQRRVTRQHAPFACHGWNDYRIDRILENNSFGRHDFNRQAGHRSS